MFLYINEGLIFKAATENLSKVENFDVIYPEKKEEKLTHS